MKHNPPGHSSLRVRLGTQSSFLERMTEALPRWIVPDGDHQGQRPLAALTTRAADDPSIAMLDAGAVVCDILCFYQERIANEGFLRTATERRSVLELARAIGYELNPGVAASTWLAFTVEEPGITAPILPHLPLPPPPIKTPTTVTVPAGTKAQSIPGAGQQAQTYETVEEIEARVAWNAMRPRAVQRQYLSVQNNHLWRVSPGGKGRKAPCGTLWFDGTSTGLKAGDLLAVHVTRENVDRSDPVRRDVRGGIVTLRVTAVTADDANRRTRVDVKQQNPRVPRFTFPARPKGKVVSEPVAFSAHAVRSRVLTRTWEEKDLAAFLELQQWDADALAQQVAALLDQVPAPAGAYAFRQKLAAFGHGAPPFRTIAQQQKSAKTPSTLRWSNYEGTPIWKTSTGHLHTENGGPDFYLEREVAGLTPGTLCGLRRRGSPNVRLFTIGDTTEASVADFAISGKATGLTLNRASRQRDPLSEWTTHLTGADKTNSVLRYYRIRNTSVFAQAEPLALSDAPIDEPVGISVVGEDGDIRYKPAKTIMLDRMVTGLAVGRAVAVSGSVCDPAGNPTGATDKEMATLARVRHTGGYTVLTFAEPLAHVYDRASLVLNANLARATHGETQPVKSPGAAQEEILGSGDAAVANQSFTLKKPPLTWVSASTPSGAESTLLVRVGGVEWTCVPSLYGQPRTARVYTVRVDDDGTTRLTFGDGVSGARLPTGRDNVTATYRSGIGTGGEVDEGQITLLLSKPPGVKNVVNPVEGSGSQDPEKLADARGNAPRTVRTLDRIVSLSDYEDFARGFAGVGKAQALPIWSGHTRLVHLTVGSSTGEPIDPKSETFAHLVTAIAKAGDPTQPVRVDSYHPRTFELSATLRVYDAYDRDAVLEQAIAAVKDAFTFQARGFAQPVTEAEIMGILHRVKGVKAVRVSKLQRFEKPQPKPAAVLAARPARWSAAKHQVLPAELLLLHPMGLKLVAP